jgi:hypothetical protein
MSSAFRATRNFQIHDSCQDIKHSRVPWIPCVPCCFEPYPMVVVRRIKVGLFFSLRASAIAL